MNFHRKPYTYIGQVNLKVTDLNRSLEFYQKIIGFQVFNRNAKYAELTADGKTVLLTIEQPDDVIAKQGRTTGLYHFALLLPSRSDLAQFVVHLSERNIPIGSADHLVSEALYLSDPDGNGIEVYRDRDPLEWTWNNDEVAMSTDPLDFKDLLAGVKERTWNGLPSDTVMGHIHLHVSDLNQAKQFYLEGLGFELILRFGGQALFIADGKYHHHIGLNTWNGVGAPQPSENSVGLKTYTIVYPNVEARAQVVTNLQRIGASVTEDGEEFLTADPSGNRIRLVV